MRTKVIIMVQRDAIFTTSTYFSGATRITRSLLLQPRRSRVSQEEAYPEELAGSLYEKGIPIYPEEELVGLNKR